MLRFRWLVWTCATALVAALVPAGARAQFPQHRIQSVFPLGGQAGENVDVQITGTDLETATGLWFDHPGLRGFHLKGTTYRVAIATGVPAGYHDVRVVGTLGVSNPRTFVVSDKPEVLEKEPNNLPAQANPIKLGSVINGRMDASPDVDCFAFEGKQGQRIFVDIAAFRVESRLDASLRLLDAREHEIAASDAVSDADPFLDVTLPGDGRYMIKVQDVVYNGSPDHAYRLLLNAAPHLDAIVPVIAGPGVAGTFTVVGRLIGGEAFAERLDGQSLERKVITWTPPPVAEPDPLQPASEFLLSAAAPRAGFEYREDGPGGAGRSNPLFVAASADPIVLDTEPNDDDAHAQKVSLPCDISGAFGLRGDLDIFRFTGKKGDVWWIEASAERLGSRADPTFVVQRVMEKGPPQDLATGDDAPPDSAQGLLFPTSSVDASLRWQVPEDGTYQVAVNDAYSSQRGDLRLFYRLNIRRGRPDFRLFVVPESPQAGPPSSLIIRAGGRELAYAVAARIDGFSGPIRVEANNLPPGLSFEPIVIGQGQSQAPLVFTAAVDAKPADAVIGVTGRALSGDRKEVLDYAPGTNAVLAEPTRVALAGALVWPPAPNPMGGPPTPEVRATRGFVCGIREGAPFLLTAQPQSWVVAPGGTIDLNVELDRRPGFVEAVQITVTDLPPNMPAANATIAKDAKTATLKLTVPANVPPGNYSFVLRGTGPYPFNKDPNAKEKPNVNVTEPSNAVSLTIRKP
jgi:hypothetical protein